MGPVAGDAVNPSMGAWPRHPCRGHSRHRTHPAFDRFSRSVGNALGVRSVFRRKSDLTRIDSISDRIYRVDQARHLPTVIGICQRWGGVAVQDRWRHRAPRGEGALLAKHCFASARTHSRQRLGRTAQRGLRRVLHSHTAPPNHQQSRAAFAVAVAVEVAGQRPALPQVQGAALPNTPYLTCTSITPSPTRACRASPDCT